MAEPVDLGGLPEVIEHEGGNNKKNQGFEIVPKNDNEKLVAVSSWPDPEEAMAKVAQRVREVVQIKT